ncbi:hypothetical protein GM418_28930 [Maribellus comscasis]|uniref:Uncharacterized protein n=1 Tax=Maribellus comscasis TaxID=2681766 RepID=A0A6I6K1P7_9BACT|nr:hypothetical protein [Maribellus comscasis]QGY47549.1 hypothetical protein GM418_28930 [Maribellus comscasis]
MQKILCVVFLLQCILGNAGELELKINGNTPIIYLNGRSHLFTPDEGLWSIATRWENGWPTSWKHANPQKHEILGDWKVFYGEIKLPQGRLKLQDAYLKQNNRIKCIRRFEWLGEVPLDTLTLSVRWQVNARFPNAFLPGIIYYGNPSGENNGMNKVPVFHGNPGEKALFEEHRYPMPFACFEWNENNDFYGAAMHTKPSPVYGGNHYDQWWSLGVQSFEEISELLLLSGPITYNNKPSVAKALQQKEMPYGETWMKLEPGDVVEKTFYLEGFTIQEKGTGFQRPIYTSMDILKPYAFEEFPSFENIIRSKYRYAKSRYMQSNNFAGFNMYQPGITPQIVLGWAGQSEAPVYALQVLQKKLNDPKVLEMVQKSMDHICTSPLTENGFMVNYNTKNKKWSKNDPVSEGQAMNSIAQAIRVGRNNDFINTEKWEFFFREACDIHLKRMSAENWEPRNTAEAFYISPFLEAYELFGDNKYKEIALKITDYYAARHFNMEEPYWGGTLDATCEDKEGAWGAFQGFMEAYECTKKDKYLKYAKHAGDVVLSYTVIWDIPLPAGRLADHAFKTRGWTGVSPQNQHLDVYGVLIAPMIYRLAEYTRNDDLKKLAVVMYRSCGQLIDPFGSQGEQIQQTNFAQRGEMNNVYKLRGGYSEDWTVFWITAHFLHAAAQFLEIAVDLDKL